MNEIERLIKSRRIVESATILNGFVDIEKAVRRVYQVGEISATTGLQKQQDGSWAPPRHEKNAKPEEEGKDKTSSTQESSGSRNAASTETSSTRSNSSSDNESSSSNSSSSNNVASSNNATTTPTLTPQHVGTVVSGVLNSGKSFKYKILALNHLGLSENDIISYTGRKASEVRYYVRTAASSFQADSSLSQSTSQNTNQVSHPVEPAQKEATIRELLHQQAPDKRINTYRNNIEFVITGKNTKLEVAYGGGGVGKTWNLYEGPDSVFNRLKMTSFDVTKHIFEGDSNDSAQVDRDGNPIQVTGDKVLLTESYDYLVLKGKITPAALFETVYNNRNKVIVFDDMEEMFGDHVEILKNITEGSGLTTWTVKDKQPSTEFRTSADQKKLANGRYSMPTSFKFTGKVVILTNKDLNEGKHAKNSDVTALLTRGCKDDLNFTPSETNVFITKLVNDGNFTHEDVSKDDILKLLNFLTSKEKLIGQGKLSFRSFNNAVNLLAHRRRLGQNDEDSFKEILLQFDSPEKA